MNFLNRFLKLILFGNIYVALGAVCLTYSSTIQLNLSENPSAYYFLVFFATLFVYNLQRIFYSDKKSFQVSVRRNWLNDNQNTVKVLTIIGCAGVCICFFFIDFKIMYYLSPLFLFSIAYFIPKIKLRKNAWFKLFTLVTVWTMVTSVVPVLLQRETNCSTFFQNAKTYFHFFSRFIFMLAISIPFDIRDIETDRKENISTFPQLMGESKARWLAVFMVIIYSIMIIIECATKIISTPILFALLINMSITMFFVLLSAGKRNEYFFLAGIDGMMILQGILVVIFYEMSLN